MSFIVLSYKTKADRQDITEIVFKVALSTMKQQQTNQQGQKSFFTRTIAGVSSNKY